MSTCTASKIICIIFSIFTPIVASDVQAASNDQAIASHDLHQGEHNYTNRLIHETSPYLLQHAYNPVEWYPWGDEAFDLAKKEKKPIFLSIGYSACHWCHVMERECFENEAIAKVMNTFFVCVKVDREEHPDVDRIYMDAVTALTGSGGWPLSAFLTPDLKPFFGGTYFPPDRFPELLNAIAAAWKKNRKEIIADAEKLTTHVSQLVSYSLPADGSAIPANLLETATGGTRITFDATNGGFGGAPKFPPHGALELLLRQYRHDKSPDTLEMVTTTLDKMAGGGMYDQLGGGFARYAVDARWLVPHFEKMLYDNAQLSQIYLEAFQVTDDPLYRKVATETLDYVLRDMLDADGGFYAAEDADSEGHEGKFYVWSPKEIIPVLGAEDAKLFNSYFDVTEGGNFEGKSILNRPISHAAFSRARKLEPKALQTRLDAMRTKLMAERDKRIRPRRDDKVLTSWNALMISSFVLGHNVMQDQRYYDAALRASEFIVATIMTDDGRLLHTYRNGKATLPGYQDDYATTIVAFMNVYEMTFDVKWLDRADALAKTMIAKFWDKDAGTFFFTADDHKHLLARSRSITDSQIPSGNASAAMALLRLSKFLDERSYYKIGEKILLANKSGMERGGLWLGHMLVAADFYLDPPKEIAIVGPINHATTRDLLNVVQRHFLPNKVVAAIDVSQANAAALQKRVPLLAGKPQLDHPAAYVCENFSCKAPVKTTKALAEQLGLAHP
jgi:uncharacterized protein YyaL (SSP411 family)